MHTSTTRLSPTVLAACACLIVWLAGPPSPLPSPARAGEVYDAVLAGDADTARELVARKADLDEPGDLGTPLHAAATKGNSEIARLLLDNGADVEATDELSGKRPLHAAAALGKTEVATLLIARGADVEARDAKGRTPLILAAVAGHAAVAEALLDAGAGADAAEPFMGTTPLHSAAEFGRLEVVELLLASGAELEPRNQEDATPLHLAAENGWDEVVKLLAARGADVNSRDQAGRSVLRWAQLDSGNGTTMALLRELGAKD